MTLNSNNFNGSASIVDAERGLASKLGGMFSDAASGVVSRDMDFDQSHDDVPSFDPFVK